MLRIADNLKLPEDAVTQTFAILAKRGVGKTYTASVFAEEMLKAGLQTVVVDPIGVWWGLRASADGKKEGLPIVIAGGDHADVPIEPSSGEILADLIIDQRLSVVIDLSLFRKGQQVQFMTDFAETLYHRNRSALHLIIDEADAFAPQRPMKGQERMLGAMEDIVRRGRARGIGVTLITQRPAVLHKDVLTQIEVLVPMRLIAPQDRSAIDAWVQVHGEPGQREELMQSLPSLPVGTAWFWSPGWLDIFKKVEVRHRETFDSSSTPKIGAKKLDPRKLADVNLEEIKSKLSETIQRVEANDPVSLRRRIIELERELAKKPGPTIEKVEVPVLTEEDRQTLEFIAVDISNAIPKLIEITDKLKAIEQPQTSFAKPNANKITEVTPQPKQPQMQISDNSDAPKITGGALRMLQTLGSRYPMTFTRSQLATLSKMSPRSGTYGTYMSLLRSNELITQDGDTISLSEKGLAYLGDTPMKPQTTDEVLDMWRSNLTGGARRMFDVLVEFYPNSMSREYLGEKAEISPTSGTFGTYLSMLAGNGLIERQNQSIKAADALFMGV